MKFSRILTIASLALIANAAFAQNVITVKASKAVKPLAESWATAYQQSHPDVQIKFTSKSTDKADLTYVSGKTDEATVAYVGRYALLPVTSSHNPLLSDLSKRSWSKGDIKKLYFSDAEEAFDDESDVNEGRAGKLRNQLTVYSGSSATSYSATFASFFGFTTGEIRGNKIAGDDLFLLNAISRDQASLTFNALANIYDTNTRALKQDVVILPLNIRKESAAIIYSGNLDDALTLLEEVSSDLIPVEDFGFTYDSKTPAAKAFLEWIISDGQSYNHSNGFLQLTPAEVALQINAFHGGISDSQLATNVSK